MSKEKDNEWITAIQSELDRFEGVSNESKKRFTVVQIIQHSLAGLGVEAALKVPGTVSRNIYHSKWKREKLFSSVLANAKKLANQWSSEADIRAIKKAKSILGIGTVRSAERLMEIVESEDEGQARLAATAVLDRADWETAPKQGIATPDMDALMAKVWGDEEGEDEPSEA